MHGWQIVAGVWQPDPEETDAGFPDLTFLQLVFGYRDSDELDYAFPDCWLDGNMPWQVLVG